MLKNLTIVVGLVAGLSACAAPYGYSGYGNTGYGYNEPVRERASHLRDTRVRARAGSQKTARCTGKSGPMGGYGGLWGLSLERRTCHARICGGRSMLR